MPRNGTRSSMTAARSGSRSSDSASDRMVARRGADAREDEVVGPVDVGRIGDETRIDPEPIEGVHDTRGVAGPVVDDADHEELRERGGDGTPAESTERGARVSES